VLAAFEQLPPAGALAAWNEIAHGKAYDLLRARAVNLEEYQWDDAPTKQLHRARL
jgi:hypothetical protein